MCEKEEIFMKWLNIYGLIMVAIIMIPNIIFAVKCRDGFAGKWHNRPVETLEQIGRFGCFGFMIFNIPGTCFGWWSETAFAVYCIAGAVLVGLYCLIWAVCFRRPGVFRALALSILPSILFLTSGILCRSVLLTLSAIVFAPCHILISYKNAK